MGGGGIILGENETFQVDLYFLPPVVYRSCNYPKISKKFEYWQISIRLTCLKKKKKKKKKQPKINLFWKNTQLILYDFSKMKNKIIYPKM